jgi:hypothetical protein
MTLRNFFLRPHRPGPAPMQPLGTLKEISLSHIQENGANVMFFHIFVDLLSFLESKI